MSSPLNIRDKNTGALIKPDDLPSQIYFKPPPVLMSREKVIEHFVGSSFGTIIYNKNSNSVSLIEPIFVLRSELDSGEQEHLDEAEPDPVSDSENYVQQPDAKKRKLDKDSSNQDGTSEKKNLLIRPYECGVCYMRYENKHELMCHLKYHDILNGGKDFLCVEPGCEKKTCNSTDMHNHVHEAHGESERTCNDCGELCAGASYWRSHVRRSHVLTWKDVVGNKRPGITQPHETRATVISNKQKLTKKNLQRIPCPRPGCERTFAGPTNLGKHLVIHVKDFVNCLYCGEPFTKISALREHINLTHREANEKDDKDRMKRLLTEEFDVCRVMPVILSATATSEGGPNRSVENVVTPQLKPIQSCTITFCPHESYGESTQQPSLKESMNLNSNVANLTKLDAYGPFLPILNTSDVSGVELNDNFGGSFPSLFDEPIEGSFDLMDYNEFSSQDYRSIFESNELSEVAGPETEDILSQWVNENLAQVENTDVAPNSNAIDMPNTLCENNENDPVVE